MSELSYLEKLLDGVEVEWRNLGDTSLFEIANNGRKPVKASLRIAGETPYYGANNIQDYVDGYTHDGEYVLIAEDGSASLENYSIQYATGKFWANNHVHVVRGKERVHSRFLYHYLCIVNFLPFLTGGGRAKLTKGQLIEIPVPIPCPGNPEKSLAIQSEIVRILDKFTALTAELTAELNMRKKQYNYYRDQLLSFDEEQEKPVYLEKLLDGVKVEWLPLGEITKYEQPTKYLVKATDYHDTYTIPVLTAGKTFILGYTNETHGIYQASKAPVIIFDDFTTANKWVDFDFKAKSSAMKMVTSCDDNKTLLKYVYYWLNTLPSEFAEGDHKRQWISNYSQKKIPIPCPDNPEKSLAIQSEIVRILDKFDTLTNSITEGLPREIELRQKQYEYYRDLLFSFPKPETASN
ncbi:restriction endonuclease subunit S [Escherichia coli]|uniref:restriction endonuclease subunit S n=1 Tax=Escherichia coli TaxID=562 RepID=UPI0015D8359B|nr:restriction endonuclease subunit S [Escherichia coli]NZC26539.1 restriction endonuclease subunit S [Escherichia coli]